MGDHAHVPLLVRDIYFYVTSHPGQFSWSSHNEYQSNGSDALQLGSKGTYGSGAL